MYVSSHTRSVGAGKRSITTQPRDADPYDARRVMEDGRRPGSGWRRPRQGLVSPRDLEGRATDAPLSEISRTSSPRRETISVVAAPTSLTRSSEFWALVGVMAPNGPERETPVAATKTKATEPSLHDLLARVVAGT